MNIDTPAIVEKQKFLADVAFLREKGHIVLDKQIIDVTGKSSGQCVLIFERRSHAQ